MNEHDRERYLTQLVRGDRAGAIQFARDLIASGVPLDEVIDDVVRATQLEVGERWERNEWSVADEHAATAVNEAVVNALLADREPSADPPRGRLVAVCAEGEWHTLALRVLTELVRGAGWDVTYLGPSVPAGQLARHLHDQGPDGLLLSCSVALHLAGARRLIETARATGTPVLAGGRGFGDTSWRADVLGADAWAASPADAVAKLDRWNRFTDPAPALTHLGFPEHRAIEANRDELVERVMTELGNAMPDVRSYTGERLARTVEDVGYLLGFLSAALLVDQPSLLSDYVTWLRVLLTSRGLPPAVVDVTIDAAARATARDLPLAAELLNSVRS